LLSKYCNSAASGEAAQPNKSYPASPEAGFYPTKFKKIEFGVSSFEKIRNPKSKFRHRKCCKS